MTPLVEQDAGGHGSEVEFRRFRTWEKDTAGDPENAWRTVAKYALLRAMTNWPTMMLHVLGLVFAVVAVGGLTFASREEITYTTYAGVGWEMLLAAQALFLIPVGVMVMFIGAPMFAEDLRFNAPLLYFSKPIRTRQYLQGKMVHLLATFMAFAFVPLMVFLLVILLMGFPDAPVQHQWRQDPVTAEELVQWERSHITGMVDWLYSAFFVLAASLSILAWITTATGLVSVYTRRAWHAAMSLVALVGGWGILGLVLSESTSSVAGSLTGPMGWAYAVAILPLELRFSGAVHGPYADETGYYDAAWPTIWAAHLFLLATASLFTYVTTRRLQRLEAVL